jgi:hypothetical protein
MVEQWGAIRLSSTFFSLMMAGSWVGRTNLPGFMACSHASIKGLLRHCSSLHFMFEFNRVVSNLHFSSTVGFDGE